LRKELRIFNGERDLFLGTFVREGLKSAFKGGSLSTILLKDVRRVSDQKIMCDHLWLNKTKAFAVLNLSVGVQIQFEARVKQYSKGYQGKKEDIKKEIKQDFKLSHPTQVEVLRSNNKNNESKLIIRKAQRNDF
jgi:hypothetical protein